MEEISKIHTLKGVFEPHKSSKQTDSFKETLSKYLKEVNTLQNKADESIKRLITGEEKDLHKVVIATQEANLSFMLLMEIRNKLVEAYKELTKTQG